MTGVKKNSTITAFFQLVYRTLWSDLKILGYLGLSIVMQNIGYGEIL